MYVLNLVINGMPSIHNALLTVHNKDLDIVLNLVINGMPSILLGMIRCKCWKNGVLNLVINGMPSILKENKHLVNILSQF